MLFPIPTLLLISAIWSSLSCSKQLRIFKVLTTDWISFLPCSFRTGIGSISIFILF